jgi:hypothetical protein
MKNRPLRLQILVAAVLSSMAGAAQAYSGYVSGTWQTWLKNGNYCDPSAQNCQGAMYLVEEFDSRQPIRNAYVEVVQGSNYTVIGQGSTDDGGNFDIYWSSSDIRTRARVRIFPRQAEGRIEVRDKSGRTLNNVTALQVLQDGTTYSAPQDIGAWYTGSSSSPRWYFNVYWAAEMQWRLSFAYVGTLQNLFTGVQIQGLTGDATRAHEEGKLIYIGTSDDALAPQSRIMHEMGHIASSLMGPRHKVHNYDYPYNVCDRVVCDGAWYQYTPEWRGTSFEEAFATMTGDTTLWWPDAVQPTSGHSSGPCDPGDPAQQLWPMSYPYDTNYCGADEGRWPLSAMRYFWHLYDESNDGDGDTLQEGWNCYSCLYDNLLNYPPGVGDHQLDEPWTDTTYSVVKPGGYDEMNTADYNWHYANDFGKTDSNTLWIDNCGP